MKSSQGRNKCGIEYVPVLIGEEVHLDGGMEHSLLYAYRDESAVSYSLAVLFCSHDYGSRVIVSRISDFAHVCSGETVMVGEVEVLDYLVIAAKIIPERSVVGYT